MDVVFTGQVSASEYARLRGHTEAAVHRAVRDGRLHPVAADGQAAEAVLSLSHSTAYFRVFRGQPEMLLEYGSADGPAYVAGREELEAVAEQLRVLLQRREHKA